MDQLYLVGTNACSYNSCYYNRDYGSTGGASGGGSINIFLGKMNDFSWTCNSNGGSGYIGGVSTTKATSGAGGIGSCTIGTIIDGSFKEK